MTNHNPIGSEAPRGKDCSERRGRYDPGWTGTEQKMRGDLMRQFMRNPEGPGGHSDAYRSAECWCACGRLRAENSDKCARCLK